MTTKTSPRLATQAQERELQSIIRKLEAWQRGMTGREYEAATVYKARRDLGDTLYEIRRIGKLAAEQDDS